MKEIKNKILGTGARKIIRGVLFFIILLVLLIIANYITLPRNNSKKSGIFNENAWGFYAEPENSIDVFVIGNSDAYSAFSPLEIWHEFGMTSYVSGQGNIMMAESYNAYLEAVKKQKPKLVILETDSFFPNFDDNEIMINTFADTIYNAVPLFKYHDRWKYVTFEDIINPPDYTWRSYSKGQYVSAKIQAYVPALHKKEIEFSDTDMDPFISFYLDLLVKEVRDNGAEILFVRFPCDKSYVPEQHDIIQRYADENGIKFLDFDHDNELVDINWKKDTRDKGVHLNVYGARKVSSYMGTYIRNNYDIPDRSDDKELKKLWDKDYKTYCGVIKKMENNII